MRVGDSHLKGAPHREPDPAAGGESDCVLQLGRGGRRV
jgi:hypothetical protein